MFDEIIIYKDEKTTQKTLHTAEKLGNKHALILFTKHHKNNDDYLDHLTTSMKLSKGLLITNTKDVKHGQQYTLLAPATRTFIDNKQTNYLFGAETMERKDKTHQRASGLNHVEAKLMKGKTYIYNFSTLLGENQATILGRMKQNNTFLKKYGIKTACMSMATDWWELRPGKERTHFLKQL